MSVSPLGIIGGTALREVTGLEVTDSQRVDTPYGAPSSELVRGRLGDRELVFLARHGAGHTIAPHRINYRANLWALHSAGVRDILAVASVGGIGDSMAPGALVNPHQLIDYTHGRETSLFDSDFNVDKHIDFTEPYDPAMRERLGAAAAAAGLDIIDGGVMGVTQGPRLETAAEIRRLARDGCDLVGMTGMPEAALARELDMAYACCAIVVNWAAGITDRVITIDDVKAVIAGSVERVHRLLATM